MPTIKLTTGGSAVVLKGGKPSCTCCDGENCDGLWGPGYDDLEGTYNILFFSPIYDGYIAVRISKCAWSYGDHSTPPFDYAAVEYLGGNLWQGWIGIGYTGFRVASFADGPVGNFFENMDGTGTVKLFIT